MGSEAPHLRFPDSPIVRPQPERIIAIGDLHGDVAATRRALRLARVLHPRRDVWTGGKTVVVQVGDQLDRGDDELAVLSLLQRLSTQAEAAGGALDVLWGNHELMASQGKFRYATPGACDTFTRWAKVCMWRRVLPPPIAQRFHCNLWGEGTMACGRDTPTAERSWSACRGLAATRAASRRGCGQLRLSHKRKAAVIVGDTLFVHGIEHQDILRNFPARRPGGRGDTHRLELSRRGVPGIQAKGGQAEELQDKWAGWGWSVGWDGGVGREQRWERERRLSVNDSASRTLQFCTISTHLEAFGEIAGDACRRLLWAYWLPKCSVSKGLGSFFALAFVSANCAHDLVFVCYLWSKHGLTHFHACVLCPCVCGGACVRVHVRACMDAQY